MFSPVVFFRMVVTVVRAHAVVISFSRFFAVFFHPFPFIIWAVFHYFIRDAHTLISNAHFFSMCANVFNRVVFFHLLLFSTVLLSFMSFELALLVFAVIRKCKFSQDDLNNLLWYCFYFNFYRKYNYLFAHIFVRFYW